MEHRSVAVVGAGVAGLTAACVLSSSYEVTLYEAGDRLGGHAHPDLTFGDFLRRGGFSPYFVGHFALPLVSAVRSCPAARSLGVRR